MFIYFLFSYAVSFESKPELPGFERDKTCKTTFSLLLLILAVIHAFIDNLVWNWQNCVERVLVVVFSILSHKNESKILVDEFLRVVLGIASSFFLLRFLCLKWWMMLNKMWNSAEVCRKPHPPLKRLVSILTEPCRQCRKASTVHHKRYKRRVWPNSLEV